MALVIATGPTIEPVSLEEAKLQIRQDGTADDDLIRVLIKTAREAVEQITRRALITQIWDYYADEFPEGNRIKLLMPPLQSVSYVKYTDEDGDVATFSSGSYIVDTYNQPGGVVLKDGESWPGTSLYAVNGVNVRFVCGYGDGSADVPDPIRAAMRLLIGHYYENREAVFMGRTAPVQLPMGVDVLLWPYRVVEF